MFSIPIQKNNDLISVVSNQTTENTQLSTFQIPQPRQKKSSIILEEEQHVKNLENIITRDFFPMLHTNDYNPETSRFIEDASTAFSGNTDAVGIKNMSLNEYLSKYNSEDNNSLEKLLEKDEQAWKKKHWWIHKVSEDHKQKQLAIAAASNDKLNNMVEGLKENHLQLTNNEAQNSLMFVPIPYNGDLSSLSETGSHLAKQIIYQNTRIDDKFISDLNSKIQTEKKSEIDQVAYGIKAGFQTPDLIGFKRKKQDEKLDLDALRKTNNELDFESEIRINGYSMLRLPSPSPNSEQSPLMTWGEIEGNALVLDTKKQFTVPETPKRELLGRELADRINKKKKMDKIIQKQQMKERLTPTPARKSSDLRIVTPNMSIFSKNIRKDSSLLSKSSAQRTNTDKIPIAHSKIINKIKPPKSSMDDLLHIK